jgi:Glycoside hydrolase family 44
VRIVITLRQTLYVLLVACLAFNFGRAATAQTPTLSVDAASGQHLINPNIYGIVNYGLSAEFAEEIKVPNIRWGGDGTTRYNWEVDSSNSGFDWYFMGGNGESNPVPSGSADLMINTYKPAGAKALITIPIIPYVNSTSESTCSFPTSIYGAQQSTNPYTHPKGEDCGNSLSANGKQLVDKDILANHVPNTTTLQHGWVQHLVDTFGTAAHGGVPFYQLDNEPGGWANTHRDIEPKEPPYSTIVSLGQRYAAMIKQVDPSAMVMGPSDFTFGGWIGTPSQQNNLFAGQYYLQQMALYNQKTGSRVLDYFDEHYYPQFSSPASQLASTRTLWDPTYNGGTWVEQYEFHGPLQLIPRFHQWISQYYPGTKLAFSEYSIDSGKKQITDALAEADVLGIFGQQAVDFANMWNAPASTDPIAYAFRLFRNYDGKGGQFGETSVSAVSSIPGNLSIYAAERSTDRALTIVVINKTTAEIQTNVKLSHYTPVGAAEVYRYSGANLKQITAQGVTPIVAGEISYNFPAYSATVFVVESSQSTE